MPAIVLIWVGLCCCIAALAIQVFPGAAFALGADVSAAWLVFIFGVFLIIVSTLISMTNRNTHH